VLLHEEALCDRVMCYVPINFSLLPDPLKRRKKENCASDREFTDWEPTQHLFTHACFCNKEMWRKSDDAQSQLSSIVRVISSWVTVDDRREWISITRLDQGGLQVLWTQWMAWTTNSLHCVDTV
jgi:hypothetical protein